MRRGLVPPALLALLASALSPAAAQQATLSVTLNDREPRIEVRDLLTDGQFVDLMRSGFPLRLNFRLELWRSRAGWFDQFAREVEWDAVARHDPLADDYVLIRSGGRVTRYTAAEDLARALAIPYRVQLAPARPGRFYFVCRLAVTTLNDTDLAELERWLRGEVSPAVTGEGSLGQAFARGAQRVLVRIAGLPRLTLEARSPRFQAEAR